MTEFEPGWVKVVQKPAPPHVHNLPGYRDVIDMEAWAGSQYRCPCGQMFELVQGPSDSALNLKWEAT
jgi:hypothetical protein